MELTPVFGALLQGNRPCAFFGPARASQAQLCEELPGSLVELAHIPHDIHVTHVIALPGIDGATVGNYRVIHSRFLGEIGLSSWKPRLTCVAHALRCVTRQPAPELTESEFRREQQNSHRRRAAEMFLTVFMMMQLFST